MLKSIVQIREFEKDLKNIIEKFEIEKFLNISSTTISVCIKNFLITLHDAIKDKPKKDKIIQNKSSLFDKEKIQNMSLQYEKLDRDLNEFISKSSMIEIMNLNISKEKLTSFLILCAIGLNDLEN